MRSARDPDLAGSLPQRRERAVHNLVGGLPWAAAVCLQLRALGTDSELPRAAA